MNKDNQREDLKLAYIAGLIDGEGSIRIQKSFEKEQNAKYTPIISFTNTHLGSVKLIADLFGSNSYHIHQPGTKGYKGNKPCYRVQKAGKNNVVSILKKLLPYLVIKKRQAELILEYADGFVEAIGVGRGTKHGKFIGGRMRTKKEGKRREKIWEKVNQLNCYHPQRLNEETPDLGEAIV